MIADDMACNPRNPRPGKLNVKVKLKTMSNYLLEL